MTVSGLSARLAQPTAVDGDVAAVIPLTKQLKGHAGPVSEIRLKAPTFGDWIECGDITRSTLIEPSNGERRVLVEVDQRATALWFQRLSGQPMAVLAQLSYQDSQTIYKQVQRLVAETTAKGN